MMNKVVRFLLAFSVLLLSAACPARARAVQTEGEILGAWTGGQVLPYQRPDSQIVFFALRADSTIALTNIYEVGPRARFWSYDTDVSYADGEVSWAYHEGHLNASRDTMWVSKDYRGDKSEWMWVRARESDSLLSRLRSLERAPFALRLPPVTGDGWPVSTLTEAGLDGKTIPAFLREVAEGSLGDLHSFLLVRHGALAVEAYFAEGGAKHGPFVDSIFRDRVHHLASATKPVASTLVGIAIHQSLLGSVDDPTVDYLPDYASLLSGAKGGVTLRHLLTMSSGLAWNTSSRPGRVNDNRAFWTSDDVPGYVLRKPLADEPGTRFLYSNGTAVVVGAILEEATGTGVEALAREHLFRPLGIDDVLWSTYPDGSVETDGGLALRPRDLAKIGQLFLQGGVWEGKRIIPEEWVREATRTHISIGRLEGAPWGYGYFWQTTEIPTPEGSVSAFFHPGSGSQYLGVIPELDLVVVFTGGIYGSDPASTYHRILRESILPDVQR